MTAGSATFATAHGVVYRVHDNAAVVGATAEPAGAAGFAGALERMLGVAYHADGGHAGCKDFAGFT